MVLCWVLAPLGRAGQAADSPELGYSSCPAERADPRVLTPVFLREATGQREMCISGSGNPKKGKEAFLHFSYEKIKAQERQTGKNSGFGVRSFGFPPCHPSRTSELLSASMSSSLKWEYDDPPCQRTVLRIRGDLAWEDERQGGAVGQRLGSERWLHCTSHTVKF